MCCYDTTNIFITINMSNLPHLEAEGAVGEYFCGAAVVQTEGQPSQHLSGMIAYRM